MNVLYDYPLWASASTAYWAQKHWQKFVGTDKAEVYCQQGSGVDALQQRCPALQELYTPPIWARNTHVHLITATVLRGILHSPHYSRQVVHCEDGGTIALDWYEGSDTCEDADHGPGNPVVMVLHPLTADSSDASVKWMCHAARMHKFRAVAYNYRGCGGQPLTSPRPFHQARDSADVHQAVLAIAAKFPEAPVFIVGFSLGAYTVNTYIGERDTGRFGPDRHVKGCVCLSSGYDFVRENSYLHVPGNFMGPKYDSAMLHYWKGYLKLHQAQLSCSPDIDVHAGLHAKSLEAFTKAVTVPSCGYSSLQESWEASDGLRWIPDITTPTLMVSAKDDPFLDPQAMPVEQCSDSPHVAFVLTKHGSHCGHMKGLWPWKQSWLDALVMQFFKAILTPGNAQISDPVITEPLPEDIGTPNMAETQPSKSRQPFPRGHGSDGQLSSRLNGLPADSDDAAKIHCRFLPQVITPRLRDGKDKQH